MSTMKIAKRLLEAALVFVILCALVGSGDPSQCTDSVLKWLSAHQGKLLTIVVVLVVLRIALDSELTEGFTTSKAKEDEYWNYYVYFKERIYGSQSPEEVRELVTDLYNRIAFSHNEFTLWAIDRGLHQEFDDLMNLAMEKMKYSNNDY